MRCTQRRLARNGWMDLSVVGLPGLPPSWRPSRPARRGARQPCCGAGGRTPRRAAQQRRCVPLAMIQTPTSGGTPSHPIPPSHAPRRPVCQPACGRVGRGPGQPPAPAEQRDRGHRQVRPGLGPRLAALPSAASPRLRGLHGGCGAGTPARAAPVGPPPVPPTLHPPTHLPWLFDTPPHTHTPPMGPQLRGPQGSGAGPGGCTYRLHPDRRRHQ